MENARPLPWQEALAEMPPQERPQERMEKYGARALRDAELLAMLLRTGTAAEDVLTVAARLVHDAGSLAGLVGWMAEDFARQPGIGKVKSLQLVAVMEIARRVVEQGKEASPVLDAPEKVHAFFQDICQGLEVEKCWVVCLNRKYRLLRCVEVSSGTVSSTLVHAREVFRAALRVGASAVIVTHNHPSGDPEPSQADINVTRQLKQAGEAIGIEFLDHIILGQAASDRQKKGWFSCRSAGLV